MAQTSARPNVRSLQKEVVVDDRAEGVLLENEAAAPSKSQADEAEKPADEDAAPVPPEDKKHTDAEAEVNEKVDEPAEESPKNQAEAPASAQDTEEAKEAEKDESEALMGKEVVAATKKPAEKPTAAPSQVHHRAEATPTQPAAHPRSSSGGSAHGIASGSASKAKSRFQVPEIPVREAKGVKAQNWSRLQGGLGKSKAEEPERQREAEDADDREEQRKIREEKRNHEAQRREDNRKAIANTADLKSLSLQDLGKIKAQDKFADRFVGMAENQEDIAFDPTAARGPSQTVLYTSKFVDRLSDVTDDMSVSGSLSIKAVKTLNFKDALVYNPLRSVNAENFPKVYGDSFISGFLKGGEFNAIVSMKILNKARLTDIKAEAKVAFTACPIDVIAKANIGIARSNVETNTEATIQVSWCGGGHIKPIEQQWDVSSLMAAASRFPDLDADCPQRTYAILTKYDALRSFVA
ncbi:hypothetical protein MMC18_001130 [Xylographa bjoerkii]|nr:hypothetical protein [Xylographa bjoerkii]